MTLHASRMIVSIIVDDTVSNNLLFTNTTLLLSGLKTLGTISMFFLGKEFSVQPLLAPMTSKAFLVINLSKSGAPIFCEFHMTMITKLVALVDCLDCSVSDPRKNLWIRQIITS